MTTAFRKAVALTAAAATPFAIAAFAAWSMGPAADGDRDVPAAVVNLDELLTTTAADGTESTMFAGRQVVTDLVADDDDGFDFRILNEEDAAAALDDGRVHAVVTIPADFSRRVTSLQGDDPQQAGVRIVTDASADGLATSLASETGASIAASFGDRVTSGFISGIYGGMGTLAEQLGTAAEGADALGSGGTELATGLDELAGGIDALADGAGGAQDGAAQLASGGDRLAEGLGAAAGGVAQLADGSAALSDGVDDYTAGVDRFAGGVQQAVAQLDAGLAGAAEAGGIDRLESSLDASSGAASQLVQLLEADPTDPAALEVARQLSGGLGQLSQQDIGGRLTAGLGQATAPLSQLSSGASSLVAAGPAVRDGAAQLADGAAQLDAGFGASATGARQLADGAGALADGLGDLESGSVRLAAGARSAESGATQLGEGARELGDGLRQGVDALPQLSDGELDDLSQVATNPVGFDLDEQRALPSGEARVAALAVPIGLWLGALVLVLVRARSARRIAASAESDGRVLATMLIRSSWVVALQAALAVLVVHAIGGVAWSAAPLTLAVAMLFGGVATLLHVALVASLGAAGGIASVVLLGLQAVAAGGIVPRDVLGQGFGTVAPMLPMTPAVDALIAIAGATGGAGGAVALLVLWLGAGLLAAHLAVRGARRRAAAARVGSLRALVPSAAQDASSGRSAGAS